MTLDKTTLTLEVGGTSKLTATVSPGNADNKNITWTSTNSSVASVSADGVVTANSTGTTTIRVKTADGGKTATCTVTVNPVSVESVSLSKSTLSIYEDETATLVATVLPSNASTTISWSSSNPDVATVSNNGVVTAVSEGTTTITARTTNGDKIATCTVTVPEIVIQTYGFVDMGLSVKWAARNVGAYAPEQMGDYYAWGEGEDVPGTKQTFNWSSYKLGSGTNQSPKVTKYNTNPSYGTVDNLTTLSSRDDIAWVLDADYHMPTSDQMTELINNCNWSFMAYKHVRGLMATSKKNGARLFFPAAGYYFTSGTTFNDFIGSYCCYWTSSLNTDDPTRALIFDGYNTSSPSISHMMRDHGAPIRAVESK